MIQPKQLLIVVWLLLVASCVPQSQVKDTSLGYAKSLLPRKILLSFPPLELKDAFDRERCADYCWRGIILGQPEEDAIRIIREDPLTDRAIHPWGDYLGIQHYENIYGDIGWNMVLSYESDDLIDGNMHTVNGIVDYFWVPIQNRFPVQMLFQSTLGLPDYVSLPTVGNEGYWTLDRYYLAYSEHKIEFRVSPENHSLTADSLVDRVIFYTQSPNYRCDPYYYEWIIMEQDRIPLYPRTIASNCE